VTRDPADPGVSPAVFDTSDYPESDRERMFVHVYSLAVMVEILAKPVHCRIELFELPEIQVRVASTSAQRSVRLAETIRMDRNDFLAVILLRRGSISGQMDGRPVDVSAGEALVADFGRPSSLEHSDHQLVTVGLERRLVARRLPWLEQQNGTVITSDAARPLFDHLDELLQRIGSMPAHSAELEALRFTELLASVLQPPGAAPISQRQLSDDLQSFERAAAFVAANLCDPQLGPDAIWRAANVSRSRLYRLFAPLGGVSKYIIQQRLLRAYEALTRVDEHRAIGRIAHDCGFSNLAHFSRAFREAFGVTAKQVRRNTEHRGADAQGTAPAEAPPGLVRQRPVPVVDA
jgi:AraC-like DNA-binding protein